MRTIELKIDDTLYSDILKSGIDVQCELKGLLRNLVYKKIVPSDNSTLSIEQIAELNSRIESFYTDRTIGRKWDEIKNELMR